MVQLIYIGLESLDLLLDLPDYSLGVLIGSNGLLLAVIDLIDLALYLIVELVRGSEDIVQGLVQVCEICHIALKL